MDIHEYQAKELLAGFGVPIPRDGLTYSPEQAAYRVQEAIDYGTNVVDGVRRARAAPSI